MNELLNRVNQWFENLPDRTRKNKLMVWLLFAFVTLGMGAGVTQVKMDMTMESYFKEGDPTRTFYNTFRAWFGSDEVAYIVFEAKDGDIFSDNSLKALHGLTKELTEYRLSLPEGETSLLDHITDVDSLINVSYMEAQEGALISRPFIGDNLPTNDEERELLRKQAMEHPDYMNVYLSKNSQYGGIMVRTDFNAEIIEDEDTAESSGSLDDESADEGSLDNESEASFSEEDVEISGSYLDTSTLPEFKRAEMPEYAGFHHELVAILEKTEYAEHFKFYPVGTPSLMAFFMNVVMPEMSMISGLTMLLIMAVLYFLFRSFAAVIWPIVVVIASLVCAIGFAGWAGLTLSTMVNIIIFLVLAVGVADTVHILSGYLFFRNKGQDHEEAMRSVFRKSALACLLTSLTTSIGMAALMSVDIMPIRIFGIIAATGVTFAFLYTVFVLPVMLDLWHPFTKKKEKKVVESGKPHLIQRLLLKVEPYSYSYPVPITVGFLTVFAILIYGTMQIKVDSNIIEIVKQGHPVRDAYNLVDNYMGGTTNLEILVDTGMADGMKSPKILNAMDDIQNYVEKTHPDWAVETTSLVNVTKDSFRKLNEDQADKYIIPQDPQVLAQTLFMFSNANPKDRRQLVSDDYRMGRITINAKNLGSLEAEQKALDVQRFTNERFAELKSEFPDLNVNTTGALAIMMKVLNYISSSQVKSFSIALVVISLLLLVVFGSKRIGLMAVIPNVFPVFMSFGLMGYLGISLDIDTLLVAPIVIGIAVDDTIHFLTHYRAEMEKHGDIKLAIQHTFREVGQAIAFTSIILAVGFFIFIISSHNGLSNFGIFSAISIMTALVADLFLLPSLCVLAKAKPHSKKMEQVDAQPA